MAILVEDDYSEMIGEMPGSIRVSREEVKSTILKLLGENRFVLAFYDEAWKEYTKIRKIIETNGLNQYLYAPFDLLELKYAPGINARTLLYAKHLWLQYSMAYKAHYKTELTKKLDRRSLLRNPLRSLLKYYSAPIMLNEASCASWKHCRACIDSCPFNALVGKPPTVNLEACTGCGVCTAYCPFGLLFTPQNNIQAFEEFLDYIRKEYDRPLNLVFTCLDDLPSLHEYLNEHSPAGPTVFLGVECPGWATELHLLAAANRGARPIIYCSNMTISKCGGMEQVVRWLRNLAPLGVPDHIVSNPNELEKLLERVPSQIHDTGEILYKNKLLIYNTLYKNNIDIIEFDTPIAGIVEVDEEKCKLCDACSNLCAFNALTLTHNKDKIRLQFTMENCIACGLCEASCPYNALTLHYRYDRRLMGRSVTVAEDEIARCRMCGRPIGSKKHLQELEEKLRRAGADEWVIEQLWLCQECKLKSLINPSLTKK